MTILAETQPTTGGGTAWFLPLMLVVMVLLLWLPMRRQKKAQAEMKAKQATMEPGTRVMTSFGLFGTLRDMDRENNKAVLEISPGQLVTVHSQTVTTVVEDTAESARTSAVEAEEDPSHGDAGEGSSAARNPVTGPESTPAAEPRTATEPTEHTGHETWRGARNEDERGNPTT